MEMGEPRFCLSKRGVHTFWFDGDYCRGDDCGRGADAKATPDEPEICADGLHAKPEAAWECDASLTVVSSNNDIRLGNEA
jgi:hypothetical protein